MMPRAHLLCVGLGLAVGLVAVAAPARAGEPLHETIDRLIEADHDGPWAAPATDGEFLRRAFLDLTGMIPTADEARDFLDDPSPYKRVRLIDALLDRPEYARRMQIVFDVMLMERRRDQHVPSEDWRQFLYESFLANKPYDQLVREIFEADGADPNRRSPAKFVLDREADPNVLTRDVGRLFLGRDLQCAQCHDHVLVDDYKQAHYYGLLAFFNRAYLVPDASNRNLMTLAEKAEGDVEYTSVFQRRITHQTKPRLLDHSEIDEPDVPEGLRYRVAPADNVRAVPRYSRRAQLPSHLTSGAVPEFCRNIVNRLWALMMGRGLVEPLDLHHDENPPSHPELLDRLAEAFAAMDYDIKAFLRELALTRAYGRSSEPPPALSPAVAAPEHFAVAALKPLSPEQMAWSVMQATGLAASYRQAAEHQLFGVDPKLDAIVSAENRAGQRRQLVEARVFDQLKGSMAPFIQQFGGAAGQTQDASEPTVHQALFLANGQPIAGWLNPSGSNLVGRLIAQDDPAMLAEELYLAVLTRRPTTEERAEVAHYLEHRGEDHRTQAIQELVWALLSSSEFRFNH